MAVEINSQAPMMLDADTQFRSALALNKTINFSYQLVNLSSKELSPSARKQLNKTIWGNMNDNACKVQATRTLIDLGVSYVYIYFGNDDRLITRVVLDKYICSK
jgi:spore germination cell wall hydrolase CwlJ-like protein